MNIVNAELMFDLLAVKQKDNNLIIQLDGNRNSKEQEFYTFSLELVDVNNIDTLHNILKRYIGDYVDFEEVAPNTIQIYSDAANLGVFKISSYVERKDMFTTSDWKKLYFDREEKYREIINKNDTNKLRQHEFLNKLNHNLEKRIKSQKIRFLFFSTFKKNERIKISHINYLERLKKNVQSFIDSNQCY